MNQVRTAFLFSALFVGLGSIFFATLAGSFIVYVVGVVILSAVTVYSFVSKSSERNLIILLIAISLSLRYVPIIKFNQPLFEDPVFDLATATEFLKNGRISVLPNAPVNDNVRIYSGFPLVHMLAISISSITGLSLFDVFTYFPPLIDLANLLLVYLLAKHVFGNSKIAALSGLIYATFSLNMLWLGIQMITQSMVYPLALMAIYLFIKGGKTDKKMLALSLFSFGVLPIAHHLTPMEIFYIIGFTLVLASFSKYWKNIHFPLWKRGRKPESQPRENRFSFPVALWLFLGASMFLYWITYAHDIILRIFSGRVLTILFSIFNLKTAGGLTLYATSITRSTNIFNMLSYSRILFLAVASIIGLVLLMRGTNRYKLFFYGFFLAPLPLIFVTTFVERLTDMRHALFLLIPVFLLTASVMYRFDKNKSYKKIIFAICLLIIIVPGPFMLFATFDPAPRYMYDKNVPFRFDLLRKRGVYRTEEVLSASSFLSNHVSNIDVISDYYATFGLCFYFDPYRVVPFGRVITTKAQGITSQDVVAIDMIVYNAIYRPSYLSYNLTRFVEDIDSLPSTANSIYDNGEVIVWKPNA